MQSLASTILSIIIFLKPRSEDEELVDELSCFQPAISYSPGINNHTLIRSNRQNKPNQY